MANESKYKATIGLEIHAELKTRTKMFCDSKNDPDEKKPNVSICPVCMGYPGTLPTINKEAVRQVLRVGMAVGGEIADFTEFDRKNYFYPDIPKGYQISQYKYPLVKGGSINRVEITRIHLEEDTARSTHEGDHSLVDFNRAGIPLMELVTEPVIHSAEDAARFAKELQLLLQYLGAGEANMEKGEMRVEANISVSADESFGTKVEVKNLNSFKAVEKAISYEVKRHIELLESGESVSQETRGWDENKQKTFAQRSKEYSHDYRYFPDPDLPKLHISKIPEFSSEALKGSLPELPWQRRKRYLASGLKQEDADTFANWPQWGLYFDDVMGGLPENSYQTAANYITSDLFGLLKKDATTHTFDELALSVRETITPTNFARLINLVAEKKITSRVAKDILAIMKGKGGDPLAIAEENNLMGGQDENAIAEIAKKVVEENQNVVAEYKGGKESALQYLVGQGMKLSRGSADPETLKESLKEVIGNL